MKVMNKHNAPLNVAGVDIRPGAAAEVPEDRLEKWANGHAAKTWLKLGLIVPAEALEDDTDDDGDDDGAGDDTEAERQKLLAEARELGLNPNVNTGIPKLTAMIAEKKGN